MSVLQDSQKKTTVLERPETVKTGKNMAESAYFFVTLQKKLQCMKMQSIARWLPEVALVVGCGGLPTTK